MAVCPYAGVKGGPAGIAAGLQSATYAIGSSVGLSLVGLCLQSPGPFVTALSLTCMVVTALCAIAPVLLAACDHIF